MTPDSSYRYELKYVLQRHEWHDLMEVLMFHPAGFSILYPERWVNNIYFDDLDFSACQSNLSGISDRIKFRYRWYGDVSAWSEGIIEKKVKHNSLGFKEYIKAQTVKDYKALLKFVRDIDFTTQLQPSIQNRYLRQYYIDRSQKFRLTIDDHLSYNSALLNEGPQDMGFASEVDDRIIVELKFNKADVDSFESINNYFPFRLAKHSKYVTGVMAMLH